MPHTSLQKRFSLRNRFAKHHLSNELVLVGPKNICVLSYIYPINECITQFTPHWHKAAASINSNSCTWSTSSQSKLHLDKLRSRETAKKSHFVLVFAIAKTFTSSHSITESTRNSTYLFSLLDTSNTRRIAILKLKNNKYPFCMSFNNLYTLYLHSPISNHTRCFPSERAKNDNMN